MAIKQDNITARYWHDTNPKRKRKDGTYPVKLMIYSEREGRNKAYRTPYHLTPDQYDSILRTTKPYHAQTHPDADPPHPDDRTQPTHTPNHNNTPRDTIRRNGNGSATRPDNRK